MRRIAMVMVVMAGLVALPATQALARTHRRVQHSHLVISQVDVRTDHAFKAEPASAISVCARAANFGKGASSRGAELIMSLLGPDGGNEIVARHDLGQLAGTPPVKRGHRAHHPAREVCAHGSGTLALPLGVYGTEVCFSDSNSQGRDGCQFCRGKCFFIGKRTWNGTVGGTQSSQDDNQAWQAGAVTFSFARYGRGQFTYSINPAPVNYQHTTTRSFCTSVGGGTVSATSGELLIDYTTGGYDIRGDVPSDATIPATVTCPGISTSSDASVQSTFLDDGGPLTALPPFGGEEKLANSFSEGAGPGAIQYHWDFR